MVEVERAGGDEREAVVDVLTTAFADYPVMRHVLGDQGAAGGAALRTLVRFFAMARLLRGHPVLAVREAGRLLGVATVTPPEAAAEAEEPRELSTLREATWDELGAAARDRYEAFGRACQAFIVRAPHHHLNMIGVRPEGRGRGLARVLLEAVHELSGEHPESAGVTLTTEAPANLSLYEYFGYRRLGQERVSDALVTWGFFRPT